MTPSVGLEGAVAEEVLLPEGEVLEPVQSPVLYSLNESRRLGQVRKVSRPVHDKKACCVRKAVVEFLHSLC